MINPNKAVFRFVRNHIVKNNPSQWYRGNLPLISGEDANSSISHAIALGKPYMVSRIGSVEIKPVLYYSKLKGMSSSQRLKKYLNGDIDYAFNEEQYVEYMLRLMCNNAGFFPHLEELLREFASMMRCDIGEVDLLGSWLNEYLIKDYFSNRIKYCHLGDLEPWDSEKPWTHALEGKKVLVIHPFEKSIKTQFALKKGIWTNPDMLPDFDLLTIKAVQSISGEVTPFDDWFAALDSMKAKMNDIEYDVALIGCGAYGLPLAAHAKRTGHVAIHLGGPLQLLFGIKGSRWDNIPSVSKYYNENWVRPLDEETPKTFSNVEGGCYW